MEPSDVSSDLMIVLNLKSSRIPPVCEGGVFVNPFWFVQHLSTVKMFPLKLLAPPDVPQAFYLFHVLLGPGGFTMVRDFGVQKPDLCLGNKLVSWRPDFSPAVNQFCTVVAYHGFTLECWIWGKLLAIALKSLRVFAALH